jgi:hypothetical protein
VLEIIGQATGGPLNLADQEPSPALLQMTEWLGRQIEAARISSPFVGPLILDARQAPDVLQGLEGKALEQARQVQDMPLRTLLVRPVMETRTR